MRKKWVRLCLIYLLAAWVLFFGALFLISKLSSRDFDVLFTSISATVVSVFISSGLILALPRAKYLGNYDSVKPSFRVFCASVVDVPQDFNFSRLKSEIAEKWEITFSNDTTHVLKFRQKISFTSWGVAAWLKYNDSTGKVYLECFPMVRMEYNDGARKMQKEIEKCLKPHESA